MNNARKRIIAFLLDMIFVLSLAGLIGNAYNFNPYLYEYDDVYQEYTEVYEEVYADFDETSITDENVQKMSNAMYKLERVNVYYYLYYLIFVIIYFVIFQWLNNGQTLGKKLFKLRVVDYNENNPNIFKYLIRYIFNGSVFIMGVHLVLIIRVILLLINVNYSLYFNVYIGLTILALIFETIFLFTILKNKDNKFLNDKIARTKVISI